LLATARNPLLPSRLADYAHHFRLICLTRYYAHKNLEIIVETFRAHRDNLKNVVVFLTIPSDQSHEANHLLRAIHRAGVEDQIINLGYIEQSEIPAYFGNCHALLFPTLLESFSTTYLEAMHCGLPILTSDLDFAHEVCGPAALYFDPWSPDSIAEAIIRLRSDEPLRRDLAEAGRQQLARVHHHSWDDMAETIVSDLRRIVGKPG
jgi:glycosyltransferase involved in cell wall biosynthesis